MAFWNFYPPGFFHDDAIYWLLSRALLKGQYHLPNDPSVSNYLPGYPLLIALGGWAGGFAAAKAVSMAATAASWILARQLLERFYGKRLGFWLPAWIVFQPLSLRYCATALSDPLFMLLALASFLVYEKALRSAGLQIYWGLSALAGYACWVRPVGLTLGAAFAADLVLRRRFRQAGILLAGPGLFQGALILWMFMQGKGEGAFLSQWRFSLQRAPPGTLPALLLSNAAYYWEFVPLMVIFPLGKLSAGLFSTPALGSAVKGAVWFILAAGAAKMLKSERRAPAIFFMFNAVIMVFWLRPDNRYLLPLIFPLICFVVECAARPGESGSPVYSPYLKSAAALAVVLCLLADFRALKAANSRGEPVFLKETSQWMRLNLPPGSVIAGNNPHSVYLHAGFPGSEFSRTYDPESFLTHLLARGVTHILLDLEAGPPPSSMGPPNVNDWTPVARMMVIDAGRYKLIDELKTDRKAVYAVTVNPEKFREAVALYRQALLLLEKQDLPGAERLLREALLFQPDMASALDRLAHIALLRGEPKRAEHLLDKALRVWPSPLLYQHRYALLGRPEDLAAARSLALRYNDRPLFWKLPVAGEGSKP